MFEEDECDEERGHAIRPDTARAHRAKPHTSVKLWKAQPKRLKDQRDTHRRLEAAEHRRHT